MPLSADDEIRAAIATAGGAITFESFMQLALYGERGFYSSGGVAGRRGDFITSPEVGPLFGAVLARALDDSWHQHGEPDRFTFVDAGAGPGTLARAIFAARPDCLDALDYVAVEISEVQREQHPQGVTSVDQLPARIECGVVFANELLDNMPFRLFVMDGGWKEAWVIAARDGAFAEVVRPAPDLEHLDLPTLAPHGARVPVQRLAGEWVRAARSALDRGRVVLVDYMTATTTELAQKPWREWLRTYRGHGPGEHYLRAPGSQDITAEVAVDQLVVAVGGPDAVCTQAQFLERWGVGELVEEGRRVWAERAARPDVAAMTMRSRVREAEALLDASGLGAFTVVELSVPARASETARQ